MLQRLRPLPVPYSTSPGTTGDHVQLFNVPENHMVYDPESLESPNPGLRGFAPKVPEMSTFESEHPFHEENHYQSLIR